MMPPVATAVAEPVESIHEGPPGQPSFEPYIPPESTSLS